MPFYESGRALLLILPVFSLKSIAFEPDFNIVGTTFVSDIAYSRILNHLIINFFMKRKVTLSRQGRGVSLQKCISRSFLPLLLLLFVWTFAAAQTIPVPEGSASNGTAATATPITTNPAKIRGNLYPNGDIDFYSFTANAGDVVYVALMTSFSTGSSNDSQLSLIASDGTTVIEFDDDNGSFAPLSSSIAGATIPTSGTYYLKVNDFTAGTTSERGYDLYLRVQSGSSTAEV